jgi:uncharacterized membrane protein YphA (DoxX/SURF4 family)
MTPSIFELPNIPIADPLAHGLQLALAAIFLTAALSKLSAPRRFARLVEQYDLLPRWLVSGAAVGVICAELAVGLALSVGFALIATLVFAICLLAGFAVAVGTNLLRGAHVPCGCFGKRDEPISRRSLARLAILLSGCVVILLDAAAASKGFNLTAFPVSRDIEYTASVVGIAAVLSLISLWILALPELSWLMRETARSKGVAREN